MHPEEHPEEALDAYTDLQHLEDLPQDTQHQVLSLPQLLLTAVWLVIEVTSKRGVWLADASTA